jgi:hypothetical protein
VRELESLLKISEAHCAKLEYKLQDLLRRIFDPKNEKLNPAQGALFGLPESGCLSCRTTTWSYLAADRFAPPRSISVRV